MLNTIPSTMRAAVLVGAGLIRIEERPVPVPAPDEVLVQVTAVGVCGSDVHFYKDGHLGDWVVGEPLILGHEAGGRIVAVGSEVSSDRIGQRVSIEPQHPSTSSAETMRGDYNLDPAMEFYAIPRIGNIPRTDGAFREYVTIQSRFAFSVPDSVSDGAAALLEPLSVAIAAGRKAAFGLGSRVLVTGAGPIGLAVAQVARAAGASEILVTDISPVRRTSALQFGATAALDPVAEAGAVAACRVDAFVDASGAATAVQAGLESLRPGGRAVLVGMGLAELPLPITRIQNNELIVTGVYRYANTWPTAVSLAANGQVDLDSMITGRFGLASTQDALESTTKPGTIKSVVEPQR